MSYSKLIHEYLDTGLPPAEEDALFQQLANNAELRTDFEKQVKMNKIASNDMNSISPPIETTNAVFSGLGFSIPSDGHADVSDKSRKPGAAAILTTSTGAGVLGSLRENLTTLFSIGLAAIISTLLFMMFDETGNSIEFADNSNSYSLNNNIPITTSLEVPNAELSESSYYSDNISSNITNQELNSVLNSIIFPIVDARPAENTESSDLVSNDEIITNEISDFSNYNSNQKNNKIILASSNTINSQNSELLSRTNTINYTPLDRVSLSDEELKMVEIELRGYNSSTENLSNRVSDNISLGLKFNFTENHSIVGYIGNDEYFVRTKNPILPSESTQFDNTNMVSYMIGYRYTQDGIIPGDFVMPYGQLLVGGLSNGFGARTELGLVLKPEERISFIIGYGTNHVQYMMEGDWYDANKNGINFGISYGM